MENCKYLLYIDILGFSKLAETDYQRIIKLFSVIDTLNVHKHYAFQTIVFSDTILIFNKVAPETAHDHKYLVMYACEFVQDLIFRCRDLNIQFRAILTYDEFYYQKLKHIEAYHGKALINAYNKEKTITGMWLYMDRRISVYNEIFSSTTFDKDFDFIFLLQDFERIRYLGLDYFPLPKGLIEEFYDLEEEIQIIKALKINIDTQSDSQIRSKYLQTYYLFKTRYKEIIEYLEANNFEYEKVFTDSVLS